MLLDKIFKLIYCKEVFYYTYSLFLKLLALFIVTLLNMYI